MLTNYRVTWRDLKGKKHRTIIYADSGYLAASICRLKFDNVDLVLDVQEV